MNRRELFAALFVAPFVKKAEKPPLTWLTEDQFIETWDKVGAASFGLAVYDSRGWYNAEANRIFHESFSPPTNPTGEGWNLS